MNRSGFRSVFVGKVFGTEVCVTLLQHGRVSERNFVFSIEITAKFALSGHPYKIYKWN